MRADSEHKSDNPLSQVEGERKIGNNGNNTPNKKHSSKSLRLARRTLIPKSNLNNIRNNNHSNTTNKYENDFKK